MEDSRLYWIAFNLVKGIGPARLRGLLAYFQDLQAAWQATAQQLQEAGLSPKLAAAVLETRQSQVLERAWETIQAQQIDVLTWQDPQYPQSLKEIDQSPPVLYVKGAIVEQDQWSVAVVGTRRVSAYGKQVTADLAAGLAERGVTVVSGLARGVDGLAHQSALRRGGRTLAVLGSGVDQIYPPEHRRLASEIEQNGAVISDYPPGTQPEALNFPPRNRIIAGLSRAVVVVEAGVKSGALITTAFAVEQGREVFAVPGNLYAPQSVGTNMLIRQGAMIYLNVPDLLEQLNLQQIGQQQTARAVLPANAEEARLMAILNRQPQHVDEIRALADLPIEQVSAALTMMELKGLARQVGGMRYVAAFEAQAEYDPWGSGSATLGEDGYE